MELTMTFLNDMASSKPENNLDMEMIARRVSGKVSHVYRNTFVPFCLGFLACAILIVMGIAWVSARFCEALKRIAV
jgi:hypothetical protein